MPRDLRLTSMLLAFALLPTVALPAQENTVPAPCRSAELNVFDFMLGKWQGVERRTVGGEPTIVGTAEIEVQEILNGCALQENWQVYVEGGLLFSSVLLRSYEAASKKWYLDYIDTGLRHQVWEGRKDGDQWRFYRERREDGKPLLVRITWSSLLPDEFQQVIERSSDNGKTWELGSVISYTRKE